MLIWLTTLAFEFISNIILYLFFLCGVNKVLFYCIVYANVYSVVCVLYPEALSKLNLRGFIVDTKTKPL